MHSEIKPFEVSKCHVKNKVNAVLKNKLRRYLELYFEVTAVTNEAGEDSTV